MPPVQSQIIKVKVSQLVEFRSRQVCKSLDELANSLKTHGQIEPLIVRKGSKKNTYEIAAGTRRKRAALIAEIDTLDCVVRDLTDQQMVEVCIAENRDRDDIHPLEEADALSELHGQFGQTIEEMAARFGRSKEYIWGRLKIAKMHGDLRASFLANRFGVKGALVLAGVAETMQAKVWVELSKLPDTMLSATKISGFIRDKYLLRLASAPFPIDNKDLVSEAGECGRCPKRTGAQASLFPDDITSEDRCTDLDCFTEKKQAFADVLIERATANELRVLDKTEAREVFKYGETIEILNPECAFVAVEGKVRLGESNSTYRELLSSNPPPVVIAINPGGAGLELYEKAAVAKSMRACKVPFVKEWESVCLPKGKPTQSGGDKPDRSVTKQERQAAELAITALREEAESFGEMSAVQRKRTFQLIAFGAARNTWSQVQKAYIKRHKIDDGKTGGDANARMIAMLEDHISKLSFEQCVGFIFEIALLREVLGGSGEPNFESEIFKRGLAVSGRKLSEFQKQVTKASSKGKDASDEEHGPTTKRSSPKPSKAPNQGKAKAKKDKDDDDDEPPVSMGGCCAICSCTRVEPCERMIDDKKTACVRGQGEELCSLCETIFDTVTSIVEDKTNVFRFEDVFAGVRMQDQVEDTEGDRDLVRGCLDRMVEEEMIEQQEDDRYRRVE